jgi:hypothetical protein
VSLVWRTMRGFSFRAACRFSLATRRTRVVMNSLRLRQPVPGAAVFASIATRSSDARPHQSAPARACLDRAGSFVTAVSRARRSGPAIPDPPRPGRTVGRFFPLAVRRRSWGCALRRVAPGLGWTRRARAAAKWGMTSHRFNDARAIRFSEHFCSSGPTCLLIDSRPRPGHFRRGDRRPEGEQQI